MANFIETYDKAVAWSYAIEEFTIIYSGSTYSVPTDRITSISIEGDMETKMFPIFKLDMTIEPSVYNNLVNNKNDLKLKMRLVKTPVDKKTNERGLTKDAILKTFSLILDDEFTNPDSNLNNMAKSEGNPPKNPDTNDLSNNQLGGNQEFYLYNEGVVMGMKQTTNTVLQNVDMMGAIAFLGTNMKIDNFLLSPLENSKVYEEILIPPQSGVSALQYLDSEYGFYKKGSMIFLDWDYSYILNFKGGCTAYYQDEIKETYLMIPEKGGQYGGIEGGVQKLGIEDKYFVIARAESINLKAESNSNDIIQGNNTTIVNTNTNSISTSTPNDTTQRGAGTPELITSNSSNEWLPDALAAQKAANSKVVDVALADFDIAAIRPNKRYSLIFENTLQALKYKGEYMLTKYSFKFVKQANEFQLTGSFTLKWAGGDSQVSSFSPTEIEEGEIGG